MKIARQCGESGKAWYDRLTSMSSAEFYAQFCPAKTLDLAGINAYFDAIDGAIFERTRAQYPGMAFTMRTSDGGVIGLIPTKAITEDARI